MNGSTAAASARDLRDEGVEWVSHILSGAATKADAAELALWRARSPDHEHAFREALRLLRAVEQAGVELRHRVTHGAVAGPSDRHVAGVPRGLIPTMALPMSRRWFVGGGVAATAAVALGVHTVMFANQGDISTATGERRKLQLAKDLTVELNTQTSVSVAEHDGNHEIRLFKGQAVIAAALPVGKRVTVVAGEGRASAQTAQFDIRDRGSEGVCVTCIAGAVDVEQKGAARQLAAGEQLVYGDAGISQPVRVDPEVVAAWQKGMLVFHDQPMRVVIAEVNRYRSGRIMINNDALAERSVDAIFYLDRMGDVVTQVQQLSGARATSLPGGVVILS